MSSYPLPCYAVLKASKDQVLAEYEEVKKMNLPEEAQEKLLLRASGLSCLLINAGE